MTDIRPPYRVPLLILGFACLITGACAGLARLGWAVPRHAFDLAAVHGPLMVSGFFGTVISLERAVALARRWAYLGPLAAGLGGLGLIGGAPPAIAQALLTLGSAVLFGGSAWIFLRQRALFTFTLAAGAASWLVGNLLWLGGFSVYEVVLWWAGFLVLTIAGERLELSRFRPPSPKAVPAFRAILLAIVVALLIARVEGYASLGFRLFGAALLALAGWLLTQDIARRTVRGEGLTRFIAVCLLSGYLWLAVGGAVLAGAGELQPGAPSYDAALHALLLGFVFSMVFGHAPIIFPAVLRVAVPYHPSFYAPLALLHASLLCRLAGDLAGHPGWLRTGGLLGAIALAAFIAGTAGAAIRGSSARRRAA